MHKGKQDRLKSKGWKIGTARDFLQLSTEESAFIEVKLELAEKLRERRRRRKLTQHDLARLLNSSQSRVAKMESGDPTVSIDLLVRSLLALGTSKREIAGVVDPTQDRSAA